MPAASPDPTTAATWRGAATPAAAALADALLGRCWFPAAGEAVCCAVSGGPDSLALLVLASWAGLSVTAVHVDHGLRPTSTAEAGVVAAAAAQVGAAFRAETADVVDGPNLEARARHARYAALPAGALTGHTADDRAETVLLNLLRGAGVAGLAGIRPGARRPLLALRRAETEAVCQAFGLDPVRDPSNRDPRHRRNRVRHEVLPLLDDVAGRDVVALLVRQADGLADVADLLVEAAAGVDATDAAAVTAAPAALARVAVRQWLLAGGVGDGYPPDGASVERVRRVARGDAVATELPGGWRVARTAGRLRLTRLA